MIKQSRRTAIITTPWLTIGLSLLAWQAAPSNAMGYGTYDTRSMAMGGAGVAIGNSAQAAYYNPALLATYDRDQDSRTYMPTLVAQASTALDAAISAIDDNLDNELSQAINAFNRQNTSANAARVAETSEELRHVLNKVANRDLTLDAFVGLAASERGEHQGGAFFVGVRTLGVATSNITPTDLDLLDHYITAMGQIADGISPILVAAMHPSLIFVNGQFGDPTTRLTSSADAAVLVIGEWGLALGKEFTLWQQPVQFGFTPKLMRLDAYRDSVKFNNTTLNSLDDRVNKFSETKSSLTTFNADIGIATLFADHYRVSLAIKDIAAKDFYAKQVAAPDIKIELRPRSRLGLGYINDKLSLGVDYDLQKSIPIARESPNREVHMGAEYRPIDYLALRLGYSHDFISPIANPVSYGIGYQGQHFTADIAFTKSRDNEGASLQMGWTY